MPFHRTGVVGYRVLHDERILEQRPVDVLESAKRSSESVVVGGSPTASPAEAAQAPQQSQLRSESTSTGLDRAGRRLEAPRDSWSRREAQAAGDKAKLKDLEKKEAVFAQTPAVVAPEPNAATSQARGDTTGLQIASPKTSKESLVASDTTSRDATSLNGKLEEGAAKPASQAMPAAPPPPPPPSPAQEATSKVKVEQAKLEQDSVADEKEARSNERLRAKKQVIMEPARAKTRAASANVPRVNRIEVGGKRFDLIDSVWRDASVLSSDTSSPIVMTAPSADLESHSRQLAPYRAVLSRPEDVLIKLDGHVYRIRKTR
ncbi:MAG: hypothetical protein FJW26_10755 [Acidimicrobiia bacterium]|nr:hypothetical protein [Acidimicrobiia bacterium]